VITLVAAISFLAPTAFAQTETPKEFHRHLYARYARYRCASPIRRAIATAFGGPLPEVNTGPGLNIVGPDGVSTKTVKAVPCGLAARETDGTTTCVGTSEGGKARKRR
jgi:hypothetical protein